jgi:hypothetical protein
MDVIARIRQLRDCGVVHCGVLERADASLPEVVEAAGLSPEVGRLRAIDEPSAQRLIARLLHRDLAYDYEMMPVEDAVAMTERFLEPFRGESPRYFSNGDFHTQPVRQDPESNASAAWNPMTTATFDTGVIVLGSARSGYLWVEDED